jgi:hypothetical protein
VVVLGPGGRAAIRNDPFLTLLAITPTPLRAVSAASRPGPKSAPRKPKRPPARTIDSELTRLYGSGQVDLPDYRHDRAILRKVRRALRVLTGTRATELGAVLANLQQIAAGRRLTPSRLPALFLTLERNLEWWTTGPLLYDGERVEFAGSQLVWEHYAGQGIELQVLGSFGKADGMYTAGPSQYSGLRQLLDELIPLAASRAHGLVWEYYFQFDGGTPPWTSAMSQGTALEALSRASQALAGDAVDYLGIGREALPIFGARPPTGVAVSTPLGVRYVQYSFDPGTDIINAFLQTLIGLYDFAKASGDPVAAADFAAGDAEARAEVPAFDTGAWSLYQPGVEDSLDYHELVTGFLHQLCARTGAAAYCQTAARFDSYMTTPPALALLTGRLAKGHAGSVVFRLSKYSHVGIVLLRGSRTVFLTSGYFGYGVNAFIVPGLVKGKYTVRLAATDLADNFNRIVGTLQVT